MDFEVPPEVLFVDSANDDSSSTDLSEQEGSESEYQAYKELLEKLSHEWLITELNHNVSKTASNEFWNVARKYFHILFEAKKAEGIRKNVPGFKYLRRRIQQDKLPDISLEFGFSNKETGEITLVSDQTTTPLSRFPPHLFTKTHEKCTLKVFIIVTISK
jgi:hypothetical protein